MDEEERYRRYVDRQWFRGLRARLPADYRRVRDSRARSREFGNLFRDGMCELLGRTAETGWTTELRYDTKTGRRFHDSANPERLRAMEFKAGRLGDKCLPQLEKDAAALEAGWTIEWYKVPGAKVDSKVAVKMRELSERYPDQFVVITVTREQFAEAIELGKRRERERTERERAREQPIKAAEQTLLRAPTKADTQRIEQERTAARADERAMQAMLNLHTRHQRAQQAEQQRAPDTGQTGNTASERDPAEAARTAWIAAERIARAMREGLPPEVARLLTEGQAQPPSAALQPPSRDTPQVTRGGTLSHDRTRGQSREQ
ncbi:hypothetical protein [Nocardia barduliensis]|uniref:hypothetical protein n=1 Tax=Nocardia barduliensis TaxID=2736643 RepID=UPI001573163E|nr:hypothetical protein [Nocardia barduliensis]